ncbi:MAG: N-acetyltransferase [Pseudomonadota bacterium]
MKLWSVFGSAEQLVLEEATANHARMLADLHAKSFTRGWTDGEFLEILGKPTACGFVLRPAGKRAKEIVAFVLARSVAGETEILTIAVASNWRRYGCGRRLMDEVLRKAHADRVESVFLEVDEGNKAAVALYKKLGFIQVGTRDGYYRKQAGENAAALVMRRDVR